MNARPGSVRPSETHLLTSAAGNQYPYADTVALPPAYKAAPNIIGAMPGRGGASDAIVVEFGYDAVE